MESVDLEQGWDDIQTWITKLKRILEGSLESPDSRFTSQEFVTLYSTFIHLCSQNPKYPHQLYHKYRETFEQYIISSVLPSLRNNHDELLLRELIKRRVNHNLMVKWLSSVFDYLDRYFIVDWSLPSLDEVGFNCFRDLVYEEVNKEVRGAIITLIDKEREGEQIDRALLKNVIDIFVVIGMGAYEDDFEAHMLKNSVAYYSRKPSNWFRLYDSCLGYMLKVEECLKEERDRVYHYMHSSSEPKLVEVEDCSRIYRLYLKIPRVFEPVANIFKQHITAEGTALVQQAEYAASNQAGNAAGVQEQDLVRKIIELHDKYMAYVTDCFQNHTSFLKALQDAFDIFCNKTVSGSSSAELLVKFCDTILKKGGSEKLNDEAIEDSLEKVVKLLAYINDKDIFAELYRRALAHRLLFDRSANDDHETKLKQQCGGHFTSKMESMVTDLTLSRENQKNFEEYLNSTTSANPGIELTITLLTTGSWPSYESSDLCLPEDMVKCIEDFKGFYASKTKNRKLKWIATYMASLRADCVHLSDCSATAF